MTAWLLAFMVHSTLWLGLAWLCTRLRPGMHARLRETIWHTALAASLVTPTAQTLGSEDGALWSVPVPAGVLAAESTHGGLEAPGAVNREHAPLLAVGDEQHASWHGIAPWVWLAIAGALLLGYGGRLEALRRRLGPREDVTDDRAHRALAELTRRAGLRHTPRLTESDNLGSPIALGFGRRTEICVPTRALHELDDEQFGALLGHEVAHHLRRDTLRLGALNSLQAVFFTQPLFRLAVREIHLAAEELCDDWAADQAEDRLAMASCLAEVAAWILPRDRRLPVPCMARRRSQLRIRVDRLMDERTSYEPPSRWRRLGAVGLLALTPWLAPAVAPATELAPSTAIGNQLQTIDAQAAALESELQLLIEELGPLADAPRYREQIALMQAQANQLRRTRSVLRSAFTTSNPEKR